MHLGRKELLREQGFLMFLMEPVRARQYLQMHADSGAFTLTRLFWR